MKAEIYNATINGTIVASFYSVSNTEAIQYLERRAEIVTLPDSVYAVESENGSVLPVIVSDERGGIGEEE
jgi:hypothetical protein